MSKAKEILNKSGIDKEFRDKRFDNFDFSRNMAIANELINHRYFNNLPVIISSELSVERILDIEDALRSRLLSTFL